MNIALIEFNPFHDECLYSQVAFIKAQPENKVFLVYNHNLQDRISYWDEIEAALPISSNQWGIGYFRILRFLQKHKVDHVVFNSLHAGQVKSLLSLSSGGSRKYFGVVHDLQDLTNQRWEGIDKKINGYFVLNDYLLERMAQLPFENSRVQAFYPMYFPEIERIELDKQDNELWVTIPGLMEKSRRDYERLLHSLQQGHLNKNIKLVFLGKSTFAKVEKNNLRKAFEDADKHQQCVFWDDFVDLSTFHSYLQKSDYLLPLLHSKGKLSQRYFDKITGLYNLGFAYGKRFLMQKFMSRITDFQSTAIFYDENTDLIEFINGLKKPDQASPYTTTKFSFDFQAEKYLAFIQN